MHCLLGNGFVPVNETPEIFPVINLRPFQVHGGAEVADDGHCSNLTTISFLLCPIHPQDSKLGLLLSEGGMEKSAAAHSAS